MLNLTKLGSLEQRRVNHVDINGRAQRRGRATTGGRIACLSSLMSSQIIALVTGPTRLPTDLIRERSHTLASKRLRTPLLLLSTGLRLWELHQPA